MGKIWFAHYDNQKRGPFSDLVIQNLLENKKINSDTFLWRQGFNDWVQLKNIPEFSNVDSKGTRSYQPGNFVQNSPSNIIVSDRNQSAQMLNGMNTRFLPISKNNNKLIIAVSFIAVISISFLVFKPFSKHNIVKEMNKFITRNGFVEQDISNDVNHDDISYDSDNDENVENAVYYSNGKSDLYVEISDDQLKSAGLSETDTIKSPQHTEKFFRVFAMNKKERQIVREFAAKTTNCLENKLSNTDEFIDENGIVHRSEYHENTTRLSKYELNVECIITSPDYFRFYIVTAEKLN